MFYKYGIIKNKLFVKIYKHARVAAVKLATTNHIKPA